MANDELRDRDEEIPVEVNEEEVAVVPSDELTPQELDKLLSEELEPPVVPARKRTRLTARRAWATTLFDALRNFVNRILERS